MGRNATLNLAARAKNDEFYTQMDDIVREMNYYRHHFMGKVVYCNCDDPRVSNFFKYFSRQFEGLGLKKLMSSCYKNQDSDLFSWHEVDKAVWLAYEGNFDGNAMPNYGDVAVNYFAGDGDFRADESVALLRQADVVVTNPPFSLFREYVGQLIAYDKQFIVLGNMNAVTYKEIFPLIREGRMWIGHKPMSTDMLFDVPAHYAETLLAAKKEGSGYRRVDGVVKGRASAIWYTNLDIEKRHQDLELYCSYKRDAGEYPEYDNYKAIEVALVDKIPADYHGVMGVPISFLDKYNPSQFELIGMDCNVRQGKNRELVKKGWKGKVDRGYVNGKRKYSRIFIKNRRAKP